MARPTPVAGNQFVSNRASTPGDTISQKRLIRDALRSSSGLDRLTTQTGTTAEVAALSALSANSTAIGSDLADACARSGNAAFASITAASLWSALVTAIAAS